MTTLTSSLVVRLLNRVSGPAKTIRNSLTGIQDQARGMSRMSLGNRLSSAIDRNNQALDRARGGLFDATAGFFALRAAITSPVQAAMDFESAMADVKKVVDDFDTSTEAGRRAFSGFKDDLRALSKEIPLTVNELAALAASAGETGIASEDLVDFTRTAAIAATAFGMTADEVRDVMFNLGNTFEMSIPELSAFNDTVNHISNSMAANAPKLLDFTNRAAGAADFLGLSADQLSGFGAALISAGVRAETAGRGVNALATRIRTDASGVDDALRSIGSSSADMTRRLDADGDAAIIHLFEKLSELSLNDQAKALKALVGQDFSDDFSKLTKNPDLLRQGFDLANDVDRAGSAFREFQVRAATFENSVAIFQNRVIALKTAIGAALIPAINSIMDALSPAIEAFARFSEAHPELIAQVTAAAASIVGFKIALAGLRFAGLLGKGGVLSMLALGFNTVGRAAGRLGSAVGQSIALQNALAGMDGTKATAMTKVGAALRGLAGVTGLTAVAGGIGAVAGVVAAISAPVWLGIAAAVTAVGVAWKYWDRITAIVSGVASAIGDELGPVFDTIKEKLGFLEPVVKPIGEAFGALTTAVGDAWSSFKKFFSGDFFSREKLTDEQFDAIADKAKEATKKVIEGVKEAFNDFLDWVGSIPGKIVDAIGSIDLADMIQWPEPPEFWRKLFGGEEPDPVNVKTEFDVLPGDQASAAKTLEGARNDGNLPTPQALAGLESEAKRVREEIAALEAEIEALPEGRVSRKVMRDKGPELALLKQQLQEVETELEEGRAKSDQLQAALTVLSETEATPEISIQSIDQALSKVNQLQNRLNALNSGTTAGEETLDGTRAQGGPVQRGKRYLVGERGPELFSPSTNGFIADARTTAAQLKRLAQYRPDPDTGYANAAYPGLLQKMERHSPSFARAEDQRSPASSPSAGNARTPNSARVTINGPLISGITIGKGTDASEVAREVSRMIEDELSQQLRGVHFDD